MIVPALPSAEALGQMSGMPFRQQTPTSGEKGEETRRRLMRAAKHLFAIHGTDGVTVRDIVAAAGQRNIGSLTYYFGSKEGLLREVLADGIRALDQRREAMLDALEPAGGPRDVRDVIEVLVRSTIEVDRDDERHDFVRFVLRFAITRRALFLDEIDGRLDTGHRRCIAHIRRLVPHGDHALFTHRIHSMLNLMSMSLSIREDALEMPAAGHAGLDSLFADWLRPAAIDNLIDAMVGIVVQPFSPATLALAGPSPRIALSQPRSR